MASDALAGQQKRQNKSSGLETRLAHNTGESIRSDRKRRGLWVGNGIQNDFAVLKAP